jgi:hypothetical protein
MKYLDLNEGERRLAIVKFEMQYGDYEYGLIARSMERANPDLVKTTDQMYAVTKPSIVKKTALDIKKEATDRLSKLGLI